MQGHLSSQRSVPGRKLYRRARGRRPLLGQPRGEVGAAGHVRLPVGGGGPYLSPLDVLLFYLTRHPNQTLKRRLYNLYLNFAQKWEGGKQNTSLPASPSLCNFVLFISSFPNDGGQTLKEHVPLWRGSVLSCWSYARKHCQMPMSYGWLGYSVLGGMNSTVAYLPRSSQSWPFHAFLFFPWSIWQIT